MFAGARPFFAYWLPLDGTEMTDMTRGIWRVWKGRKYEFCLYMCKISMDWQLCFQVPQEDWGHKESCCFASFSKAILDVFRIRNSNFLALY